MGLALVRPEIHLAGKLLILEDDLEFAQSLSKQIERFGLESQFASSISEVREMIDTDHFHAMMASLPAKPQESDWLFEISQVTQDLDIPLLLMSTSADKEALDAVFHLRALELLVKPFRVERIAMALQSYWEEPKGLNGILDHYLDIHHLTTKEKTIVRLLLKGLSNKEIASVENVTVRTIKSHITHVFHKCDVTTRAELFNAIFPI